MMRTLRSHPVWLAACLVLGFAGCTASSPAGEADDIGAVDAGSGLDGVAEADIRGAADAASDDADAGVTDTAPDLSEDDGGEEVGPVFQICGNGIVEGDEVCDDGNRRPLDGCNATCDSDETCGNGVRDLNEACDDGNREADDGCSPTCTNEQGCGDGIVDRGEQCDDGNLTPGDGCSAACTREAFVATDSDNDTISDFDEGLGAIDTDGDSFPDDQDLDSDGDGILDAIEAGDGDPVSAPVDTDGDGRPDFRDTDADGDTLPDELEGAEDPDGDGLPNFQDVDSDGDYVPDAVELARNTDGDAFPDYLDRDSDGDGILDLHELFADSDGDGSANRLDLDSDNDGIPDAVEAGDTDPETYPVDTDADGQPDYIDRDADDDGLPDEVELGCSVGRSERTLEDTDGDGYTDLAESLLGSNPCTFTDEATFATFTDFYFILPEADPAQEAPLEFSSNIVTADVAIAMDTTFSMSQEIAALRNSFQTTIVPSVASTIENVAFAVSTFDDFPCNGHGVGDDRPFILRQRITTNVASVQTAIAGIGLHNGADLPESGYESMYQVATGAGINHCGASIPAFNPSLNLVPGVADGTIGGVGFRVGAFPIVVHVTDDVSHEGSVYGGPAASSSAAIGALRDIQARLVGVVTNDNSRARTELQNVARQTEAIVPVCAWDGVRPSGCGATQCCTALNGNGRASESGSCPLVFDVDSNGNGLTSAMVTAIEALANTTSFSVTTQLRRDEAEFAATGFDTTCFVRSITPASWSTSGGCTTTPQIRGDTFLNVTPGTALFFDVEAVNDGCMPEGPQAQVFSAFIDVIGDGLTVLDSQRVTVIVPAEDENPSTVP